MATVVYIDGENLFHAISDVLINKKVIKHRNDLIKFDMAWFINEAAGEQPDTIRYYGTRLKLVRSEPYLKVKSLSMIKHKRAWGSVLQSQGIDLITAGTLKVRDGIKCRKCGHQESIFQEKGVDVRLAIDMVTDALNHKAERTILISSDTDLLSALQRIHGAGVRTVYVAYSKNVNSAMTVVADETLTFSDEVVLEAYKRAEKHE